MESNPIVKNELDCVIHTTSNELLTTTFDDTKMMFDDGEYTSNVSKNIADIDLESKPNPPQHNDTDNKLNNLYNKQVRYKYPQHGSTSGSIIETISPKQSCTDSRDPDSMLIHHSNQSYGICSCKCSVKETLQSNMYSYSGEKPYECKICGYKFSVKGNLRRHMCIHTGEKPYKCEVCEYKCLRKEDLQTHMHNHTGEKPYQCEICSYKSSYKRNLKTHMRTHTGEKHYETCTQKCSVNTDGKYKCIHTGEMPYKCDVCGRTFSQKVAVERHMYTHTGEKPYECGICGHKCIHRGDLKIHIRIHTGEKPYECALCEYKSSCKSHVRRHMRTHIKEKPYKCELCRYTCSHKSTLRSHMHTHA